MEYIVNTPCGKIKGIKVKENIIAYKGIRYAKANRFEYPTIVSKWDGVYDATKYGNCSYQPRSFYNEEENLKKVFYYNEFRKNEKYTYSEDCLFLNIFTPLNISIDDNLPVIIYIHGGGFTGGCAHEKHFDEPIWPTKGVIGVTINYRLGPLGFIASKELKEEAGNTGNYGLYDQLTAIKWVRNNIKAFGGNPDNITIMGQSAGAMSVQQLCLSPLTTGLFNKAVMSSGGGLSKILPTSSAEKRFEFWDKVKEISGAKTLEEFKKIPVEVLFDSFNKAKKELKVMGMVASPVIDGKLITDNGINILKANNHHKIPYMLGSTSEDLMSPFMQGMASKWCYNQEIPSYCWMFDHQLPGDDNGAWHSSDLWYWFGALDNCWRPLTDNDYKLSDMMTTYLTNFVKNGNPNGDGLITWNPTYKKQKQVIHFNSDVKMKKVKKLKLWVTMFTNKAVGE
jgi:para-nitrobenzyl esterase